MTTPSKTYIDLTATQKLLIAIPGTRTWVRLRAEVEREATPRRKTRTAAKRSTPRKPR